MSFEIALQNALLAEGKEGNFVAYRSFCERLTEAIENLVQNPASDSHSNLLECAFYSNWNETKEGPHDVATLGQGRSAFPALNRPTDAEGHYVFSDLARVAHAFREAMGRAATLEEKCHAFCAYKAAFKNVCRDPNGEPLAADAPHIHRIAATLFPELLIPMPVSSVINALYQELKSYLPPNTLLQKIPEAKWFLQSHDIMGLFAKTAPAEDRYKLGHCAWRVKDFIHHK